MLILLFFWLLHISEYNYFIITKHILDTIKIYKTFYVYCILILLYSRNVTLLKAYVLQCTPLKMATFLPKHAGLIGYFVK
jgi:hypothetical protein